MSVRQRRDLLEDHLRGPAIRTANRKSGTDVREKPALRHGRTTRDRGSRRRRGTRGADERGCFEEATARCGVHVGLLVDHSNGRHPEGTPVELWQV